MEKPPPVCNTYEKSIDEDEEMFNQWMKEKILGKIIEAVILKGGSVYVDVEGGTRIWVDTNTGMVRFLVEEPPSSRPN